MWIHYKGHTLTALSNVIKIDREKSFCDPLPLIIGPLQKCSNYGPVENNGPLYGLQVYIE